MRIHLYSDDFEILKEPGETECTIHSVFTRVFNLECGGALYALTADSVPIGPLTASLDGPVDFQALGLLEGQTVKVGEGRISVSEAGLEWPTDARTGIWSADLDTEIKRVQLERIQQMAQVLVERGDPDGLLALMPLIRDTLPGFGMISERFEDFRMEHLDFISGRILALLDDLEAQGDITAQRVRAIVGFGPGLTPSTDDFLVGLMAGLLYSSPAPEIWLARFRHWMDGLDGRTTRISLEALKQGTRGRFNSRIRNAAKALSDERGTQDWEALLSIGQTSGTDLAAGIYIGALYAMAKEQLHEQMPRQQEE